MADSDSLAVDGAVEAGEASKEPEEVDAMVIYNYSFKEVIIGIAEELCSKCSLRKTVCCLEVKARITQTT